MEKESKKEWVSNNATILVCLENDWVSSITILYNLVQQLKRNKVFSIICTIHTFEKNIYCSLGNSDML